MKGENLDITITIVLRQLRIHHTTFFEIRYCIDQPFLPKNILKFKLLAFWRKLTPFIDQKCTYEKVTKIWAGPSLPLI